MAPAERSDQVKEDGDRRKRQQSAMAFDTHSMKKWYFIMFFVLPNMIC